MNTITPPADIVRQAITRAGVGALARRFRLTRQAIEYWRACGYVPHKHTTEFYAATGVPRWVSCPHVYGDEARHHAPDTTDNHTARD